ncbi:MAG TPA: site-specific integrase [Xanthobacteraceae bacterium]
MSGHIVERGPGRWAIVLETRGPAGQRRQRWHAFKGTKREALKRLAELVTERERGTYVEPSKQTVAVYFTNWLENWAPMTSSPKTLEAYKTIIRRVIDALGGRPMQQVRGDDLNRLYLDLRARGLSPRTVKHTHVLAKRVFGHALRQGDIKVNPVRAIDAPKVPHQEAAVLRHEEVSTLFEGLRGSFLYPVVVLAIGTGMRRGELCALRWQDVDLEGGKLEVRRSLEETTAGGLRFKEPKSARGRRSISLAPSVIACLQEHRKGQLELRMKLGQGKPPADELVFTTWGGGPRHPDRLSTDFSEAMDRIGLPHISLHSLRHTHASELIRAGVDIITVSRRLGHASAAITLGVYGHLMTSQDGAADVVEAMLKGIR